MLSPNAHENVNNGDGASAVRPKNVAEPGAVGKNEDVSRLERRFQSSVIFVIPVASEMEFVDHCAFFSSKFLQQCLPKGPMRPCDGDSSAM
jgi:hypothetical protein